MASCPQCKRDLQKTETPAGRVPGCGGCGHVWLEARQIEALQATTPRHYVPDDLEVLREECAARKQAALKRPVVYFRCPACGEQMLRRNFSEASYLLVHYCATHGYWIRRDELEGIVSYIARGGEVLEMAVALEKLEYAQGRLETENRRVAERGGDSGGFFLGPYFLG